MHAPRALAAFNRVVTNPIQRRWAGRIPLHAIIEHTGRRSGKAFRTPVLCFRRPDGPTGFVFLIGYGRQSDWVRNLVAAGGGRVEHRGTTYDVSNPTVVQAPQGRDLLPRPLRLLTRLVREGDVLTVDAAAGE
ncbi:nitroreductase family deazaflavin-dependent oxidoreductase [Nocardioides sp. Kera G14]|uniref:nitroreductase family deazaflavin-dependent oxidoreductase n=1 Tax=Nocardioides sp. Kera G14 TaxID=2884264 RepID=UPI001D11EEFA|nr:nitroreductase family deazaflavin-dependent oxidoreductase [Nocardioides sp. Kera G14]UDY22967.1 nitroreductase family deazaflavin-dependent oxidoreductase [Nocardioides sp. Kera G14]